MTDSCSSNADDAFWDGWEDWKAHYSQTCRCRDLDLFFKDGIVDDHKYKSVNIRLLFVLREAHNRERGDLRRWLASTKDLEFRKGRMVWYNLARWSQALLEDHPEERLSSGPRGEKLQHVAAINLKKVAGGPKVCWNDICKYVAMDRHLLIRQIRDIRPQLIIACGTFDLLRKLLMPDGPPLRKTETTVWCDDFRCWLVKMNHPAARIKIHTLLERLCDRTEPCFTTNGGIRNC